MESFIVFGNSITQGAFDHECGGWVNRLSAHCSKLTIEHNYEDKPLVFNLGISGEDVTGILNRYQSEVSARLMETRDHTVIFAIGVNDSRVEISSGMTKTEPEVYKQSLSKMVTWCLHEGFKVVCVGLAPVDEKKVYPMSWAPEYGYLNKEVQKFDSLIKQVSKEHSVPYVSLRDAFGETPEQYVGDGVHPNAEGHRRIFERVKETLESHKLL